jgi:hypothetical protein
MSERGTALQDGRSWFRVPSITALLNRVVISCHHQLFFCKFGLRKDFNLVQFYPHDSCSLGQMTHNSRFSHLGIMKHCYLEGVVQTPWITSGCDGHCSLLIRLLALAKPMVDDYKDFGSRRPERESLFPWANGCLFGTSKVQAQFQTLYTGRYFYWLQSQ